MKPCRNGNCRRPGLEYAYALGRRLTVVCDTCHAALSAIGMVLKPTSEDTRPAWLRYAQLGRDETGRVSA